MQSKENFMNQFANGNEACATNTSYFPARKLKNNYLFGY